MRFHKRGGRDIKFEVTRRKLAALECKQRRELEALPLFAAEIAAQQPNADAVMDERRCRWEKTALMWREFDAQQWRSVRKRLFELPHEARLLVRAQMREWRGPPDVGAWAYMIRKCHTEEKGN